MDVSDKTLNMYYRYAVSLTGNTHDAFDLVHEAIIKSQGRKIQNQDAYILKSIKNLFINRKSLKDNQTEELTDLVNVDLDLDKIICDKFHVEKLMNILSPMERELVFLIEVEGYTYKELEKLMGINQGTLLSKVHRVKKKIINWSQSNE